MSQLLVFDFDGTMTDAEREGAPYRQGYLADLAVILGAPLDETLQLARRFEDEILAAPGEHGWLLDGRIVAPASVDPYLRVMPVARKLLDHHDALTDPRIRSNLLDGILYKYNYAKTHTAFRDGAGDLLRALEGREVFIVTNSHTDPVRDKLRALSEDGDLDWLLPRVRGSAKKYIVDDDFDRVDAELHLPGLDRPVLLRRRQYFDTLDGLLRDAHLDWPDLLVVGDIFELDLALPLALGARVVLVAGPFTPPHERTFLERHPRAHLVSSLDQLHALLQAD